MTDNSTFEKFKQNLLNYKLKLVCSWCGKSISPEAVHEEGICSPCKDRGTPPSNDISERNYAITLTEPEIEWIINSIFDTPFQLCSEDDLVMLRDLIKKLPVDKKRKRQIQHKIYLAGLRLRSR